MTVLPPEAPGPNPGQPGHFAHTDWLTASVKALDVEAMDNRVPVGTIVMWYGATAPPGWLICDGTAIPGSASDLIALIGSNLPDLRGRFPIGVGTFADLGENEGDGETSRTPYHNHSISSVSHTGATTAAGGSNQNKVSTLNGTVSGSHNHGGATGTNLAGTFPFLGVHFIIKA